MTKKQRIETLINKHPKLSEQDRPLLEGLSAKDLKTFFEAHESEFTPDEASPSLTGVALLQAKLEASPAPIDQTETVVLPSPTAKAGKLDVATSMDRDFLKLIIQKGKVGTIDHATALFRFTALWRRDTGDPKYKDSNVYFMHYDTISASVNGQLRDVLPFELAFRQAGYDPSVPWWVWMDKCEKAGKLKTYGYRPEGKNKYGKPKRGSRVLILDPSKQASGLPADATVEAVIPF